MEAETSRIDLEQRTMIAGKKTEAGYNRIIPLHEKIVPLIEARMDKETLEEVNADNYRKKYYYPALEKLGLEKKVPHVCRHTCATRMAEAGLNPMTIKQILGHTDYAFTANKYTHIQLEAITDENEKARVTIIFQLCSVIIF